MKKLNISVDMVKEMAKKNFEIFDSWNEYKASDLYKAIKRGEVDREVYAYVYNCSKHGDYSIRREILKRCGYTFKEACSYKMINTLNYNSEWNDFICFTKNHIYFESLEDFLNFSKTQYGVDFDAIKYDTPVTNDFRDYVCAISDFVLNMFTNDEETIKTLKKLYIDLTPYLIKVRGLISSREDLSEARIYTKFFTYAWFIDVDLLKKLVEEKDFSDDQKAKIYMAAFKKFIRTLSSRMKVCDDKDKIIYDLIPTINKFISNKNVDEYDYKDYMEYLLCFCKGDYKDGDWKLNEDQKESLFKSSIEPWLNRDCPFTRYPLCDVYLGAAMCLTPNDKLDEMVKKLNNIFSLSKILCVLVEEVRLSGSTLDVTENITNMLIEHGYTWTNNLVIPREKAYDLDYLESICDKVGEEGILFGSQWNDNYFGIRHVDVKRLPDEFYTKYAEYIYWVDLSRSPFIDLEYMKKHFNSIKFGYISSKVSAFIDDEMAKKILEKYHEVGYRYIQYSESLSLEFTAKHLNHLWYNEYCRKVSFLGGKGYAIKELLEAM